MAPGHHEQLSLELLEAEEPLHLRQQLINETCGAVTCTFMIVCIFVEFHLRLLTSRCKVIF